MGRDRVPHPCRIGSNCFQYSPPPPPASLGESQVKHLFPPCLTGEIQARYPQYSDEKMEIIQVGRKARLTINFQYEKDGNNSNGNKGQDPSFQYSPPPHPAWKEDWDRSLKHRLNIPPLLSWPQCNKNKKVSRNTPAPRSLTKNSGAAKWQGEASKTVQSQ